jgi:leucyl aminopeptidase
MKAKVQLIHRDPFEVTADAVLLLQWQEQPSPRLSDARTRKKLAVELERRDYKPSLGKVVRVVVGDGDARRDVIVAGLGPKNGAGAERLLTAVAAGARVASELKSRTLACELAELDDFGEEDRLRMTVQALRLAGYTFDKYLMKRDGRSRGPSPGKIVICTRPTAAARRALAEGGVIAEGVALARDLVNEPAAAVNPTTLASRARAMARRSGLSARVLGPREIERERMGALAAVARGSDIAPRVVHLRYKPRRRAKARLALVGKGVTFDSGGYNLKPSANILDMKCDMAGAAAVLGAMQVLAELALPVEIHGVIGLVENLVSGKAYKPGDVLITRRGKSVEINNTDAEGRLVLADLLDYVCTEVRPDAVVDVATLTGACVIALGPSACGVMSNEDELRAEVLGAAGRAGEKAWALPLYADYLEQLSSDVADLKNTGQRYGGALTAGLFLSQFVREGTPWAHIDIAGPAFLENRHAYWGKGGTGFAVGTLVELVRSRSR